MFRVFALVPMLLLATEEATRLNNLAALSLQRGDYSKAEELFQAALASLPADSESGASASIMANLCELNRLNGRHAQAELWCERSLKVRERVLGKDDPADANALNTMACIKLDLGEPDAAEQLARRAIRLRERAGMTEDSPFAAMLHNLGEALRRKRDWIGAEAVLKKSSELRRALGGEKSLDYTISLQTLAALRRDQLRLEEAYDLNQQALATRVALLGPSHPFLGGILTNLSLLCLERRELAAARDFAARAVTLWEKSDTINLASALMNAAQIFTAIGDFESGASHYRHSIQVWSKVAPNHPAFASCLKDFARLLEAQGRYAAAEQLLRQALAITPDEATAEALSVLLRVEGRLAEAGHPIGTDGSRDQPPAGGAVGP